MKSRQFTFLLLAVFVLQLTFPLLIQPILGWRVYFLPPWDYFKYPETKIRITDVAIGESGERIYMRGSLSYFEVHFFDFITSTVENKDLLAPLKKRFVTLSKIKEPMKAVEFECDPIKYFRLGYDGCSLVNEEWLE